MWNIAKLQSWVTRTPSIHVRQAANLAVFQTAPSQLFWNDPVTFCYFTKVPCCVLGLRDVVFFH